MVHVLRQLIIRLHLRGAHAVNRAGDQICIHKNSVIQCMSIHLFQGQMGLVTQASLYN